MTAKRPHGAALPALGLDSPGKLKALPRSFWRSPRIVLPLPQGEIEIPSPSPMPSPPNSLLTMLLPAVLMVGVMVAVGFAMGTSNWLLFSVPMMLASSLASVVTYYVQRRKYKKQLAEREQSFTEFLSECEQRLAAAHREHQQCLWAVHPSPEGCLELAQKLDRNLWARRPTDEDFLVVRLGLGDTPCGLTVKLPQDRDAFNPDPLIERARALADSYRLVPDCPVCLHLAAAGISGIAGPPAQRQATVNALIMQLATHHAPHEVKLAAIFRNQDSGLWRWMRWLPHTWSEDGRRRYLADSQALAHELLTVLEEIISQREQLLQDRSAKEAENLLPKFVLLLAAPEYTVEEPALHRIQTQGPRLGIYPVFIGDHIGALPQDIEAAVRVGVPQPFVSIMSGKISTYLTLDSVSGELAEAFAHAMAPIQLQRVASPSEIPESVSLFELYQVQHPQELDVPARWKESARAARVLKAPLGIRAGGEILEIDLHERGAGPNGLVAGMVGAGKSELLQTLVISLAINYHPHRVAFVLIDYKGGGMADPFAELPHTLGMITNLQEGDLAARAILSLNVESERRQRLFRQAKVNHIDDYQRLYYQGQVDEPVPYLVIIVDEFAEMKTEKPELAQEFVRIARLGRALGFRLILAMQKPAGIVDGQIEANTRFRLCLRVAQTEDSRAMLRRPEAAYLSQVGRAYFQVGVNEAFHLLQVAWSGAPYNPAGQSGEDPHAIYQVHLDGTRTLFSSASESLEPAKLTTELSAAVQYIKQVSHDLKIAPLKSPWVEPLPDRISLEELGQLWNWSGQGWAAAEEGLAPVIGLVDEPRQQRQRPLPLRLSEGHLAIYGAPGFGKTTLLMTLVTSVALTYPPSAVNVYVLDFDDRLLRLFEPLPHVGAVITIEETERVQRLLRFFLEEMERRRQRFSEIPVSTLTEYNRASREHVPELLFLIDNYAAFQEAFEDLENDIVQIAREGANLGVHLVLTANSSSGMRYRLTGSITSVVALHLVEKGEYGALLGRTDDLIPKATPGRGLIRGAPALEFQTALPASGRSDAERNARLREQVAAIAESWNGEAALPVRTLPEVVSLEDLLAAMPPPEPNHPRLTSPLGLRVQDLGVLLVDLEESPYFLITGPAQSGKSTLLKTWVLSLASRLPADELAIYILDSQRMSLADLRQLAHVVGYACEDEAARSILSKLDALLGEREQMRPLGIGASNVLDSQPTILLVVDGCLDQAFDGTSDNTKLRLHELLRRGRGLGLYLLVAAEINDVCDKGWQEPIKTIRTAQAGFVLGAADDRVFDLRLPYKESGMGLQPGEGYYFMRGRSQKIKVALPSPQVQAALVTEHPPGREVVT